MTGKLTYESLVHGEEPFRGEVSVSEILAQASDALHEENFSVFVVKDEDGQRWVLQVHPNSKQIVVRSPYWWGDQPAAEYFVLDFNGAVLYHEQGCGDMTPVLVSTGEGFEIRYPEEELQ